jgi:hypothetical protein
MDEGPKTLTKWIFLSILALLRTNVLDLHR